MLLRLLTALLGGLNLTWDDTAPTLELTGPHFEPTSTMFSLWLA